MLKVEVGYYDFLFPDEQITVAYDFAKMAYDHISKDDQKAKIVIKLEREEEEEQ